MAMMSKNPGKIVDVPLQAAAARVDSQTKFCIDGGWGTRQAPGRDEEAPFGLKLTWLCFRFPTIKLPKNDRLTHNYYFCKITHKYSFSNNYEYLV